MSEKTYTDFLADAKLKIKNAQLKTVIAANSQMLYLYWQIGNLILQYQNEAGWGAKIIDNLSNDLKREFPDIKGFSSRNLKYMRSFSESYPPSVIENCVQIERQFKESKFLSNKIIRETLSTDYKQFIIVQQAVAQIGEELFLSAVLSKISWSHHVILMDKLEHIGKRFWYMFNAVEHGSSRNVLALQIDSNLYERQIMSDKVNNFESTLPPHQSDFANYLFKDPYLFDFVQVKEKADERNIEEQLANQITKFLLELGQGFAFMGRQVHFELGEHDFYADLLFYHTKLRAYVVVELKSREFEPGDASQLNFYINLINDKMKSEQDNDTIGLLLCKGKNNLVAEYALKGFNNAIGISNYEISKAIPNEFQSALPQIEDIENELGTIEENIEK